MEMQEEPPRVIVLYNRTDHLVKGESRDLRADQGVVACAQSVADALASVGCQVALVPLQGDVEVALMPYPPAQWVVFNLGEGLAGRLFEEVRIAWALEAMGYRFTGADAEALARSTHKARCKALLAAAGLDTPPWRVVRDPALAPAVGRALGFPLIVKPVAEDASIGVDQSAVVHGPEELESRIAYILDRYHQVAIAERFITGREFNLAVWEAPLELLPLAEIDFNSIPNRYDRIVSFDAKWDPTSWAFCHTPVICPAQVDPETEARLKEVVLRAWNVVGCRGYARFDIRVDEAGTPFIIEVNCNPDLSPDGGFCRAAAASGHTYVSMVAKILNIALEAENHHASHHLC